MEKSKTMNNSINLGLCILRMILAFWVVVVHLKINNKKLMKIILKNNFHVPTFMNMSFYFFFNNLFSRNINKMKIRFIRLLIPYTIWPLLKLFFIIFVHLSKFEIIVKTKFFLIKLKLKFYLLQKKNINYLLLLKKYYYK